MATYQGRFKFLAKPGSEWASADPVLLLGEFGVADPGASTPVLKVGDGVRPWSALPQISGSGSGGSGADYVAGPVTTLPPGSPATVVIDNSVDPPTISFGIPAGEEGADGAPGPANSLAIGTVTTGAPGSIAAATITGTPPAQTLNLTIPTGAQGPQGIQGVPGTPGAPGPANFADPSAQIGLAMIPGVSANAMRADAAPALNQAIAPTWTGAHIFTSVAGITVANTAPLVMLDETDAAANERLWRCVAAGGQLYFDTRTDASGAGRQWLMVDRTGVAIAALEFGNATDNPSFAFSGTGVVTSGGVHRGPLGDATAPTYSFTGLTNAGMYAHGDGSLRFATAGVVTAMLDGINNRSVFWSTIQAAINGTAAAPAYSFSNSTGAGLYLLTTNRIGLSLAGALHLDINTGGLDLMTGALSVPSGSATGPGYAFGGDADTGMYRYGPEVIGFTTAGTVRAIIYSAGLEMQNGCRLLGVIGTAAAPGFAFAGDTATGMWRAGTNTLGLVGGGATGLYVDGTGAYLLNGSASVPSLKFNNDTDTGIYLSAANEIAFACGSGARMTINTAAMAASVAVSAPSFTSTSGRAIKRETGAPAQPADILARLRPILYRLLADDEREQLGLIAEEVHEVCPQLSDGATVAYDRLAILLLAAWQDEHAAQAA